MSLNGDSPGQAQAPITKESLFPERYGKPAEPESPTQPLAEDEDSDEESAEELAQAQDDDEQAETEDEETQIVSDKMSLGQFLNHAGYSMHDFYNDVYVERDGEQVSLSKAWDDYGRLKEANDALLRERAELRQKTDQIATQVPHGNTSPEAAALLAEAQVYQRALTKTNWEGVDPGQAANQKFELYGKVNELTAQAQQAQMKWMGEQQAKMKEAMEEADRQTRSRIPEWNDGRVRASEWTSIGDLMAGYGFNKAEIDATQDPRARQLLRDAWRAMQNQKRIEQGARKIRKVSKTLPSAARDTSAPTSGKVSTEQARELMKSAKTKGDKSKLRHKIDFA